MVLKATCFPPLPLWRIATTARLPTCSCSLLPAMRSSSKTLSAISSPAPHVRFLPALLHPHAPGDTLTDFPVPGVSFASLDAFLRSSRPTWLHSTLGNTHRFRPHPFHGQPQPPELLSSRISPLAVLYCQALLFPVTTTPTTLPTLMLAALAYSTTTRVDSLMAPPLVRASSRLRRRVVPLALPRLVLIIAFSL